MSIQLGSLIIALPQVMPIAYWIILGIALIGALLISSYQLYHRLIKSSIGTKTGLLSLNILAFLALTGLIVEVKIGAWGTHTVTLITPNVPDEQLTAVVELEGKNTLWYITAHPSPQSGQTDKPPELASMPDPLPQIDSVAQIAQLHPDLQQLNVIGDGLTAVQWQQLFASHGNWGTVNASKLAISWHPAPKLTGPINLNWQKQLVLGEALALTGELQAAPAVKTRQYILTLVDPAGQIVEQKTLNPNQPFSFNVTPHALGTWLYQLKLTTQETEKPITIESIAVDVSYPPLQAIAIWQSAPSFETRQLKDWAASFGNRLTVVSQISRDKLVSEQLNTAPNTILPQQNDALASGLFFTTKHLEKYDLLFIDGRALVALNNNERARLKQAVTQGLGLMVLADGDLLKADNSILTSLTAAITVLPTDETRVPAALYWQQTKHPESISWLPGDLATTGKILIENEMRRAIVVSAQEGLGQIAVSLINTSYTWYTRGHSDLYSQYWQYLIKHIARNRTTDYWLAEPDSQVTVSDHTHKICSRSASPADLPSGNSPLQATQNHFEIDGQPLPLMLQTSLINDTHQCAYYWATQPGWQRFVLTSSRDITAIKLDEQTRYVYPTWTWQAWQQSRTQQVTAQIAKRALKAQPRLSYSPVPKWYFYLSLVFVLTLLWIARKRL